MWDTKVVHDSNDASIILQREYQWDSSLHGTLDVSKLLPDVDSEDREFWVSVFELASQQQLHGAAVRALQSVPLNADEDSLNFLSDVLSDSRPMIRYIALERLARIDPKFGFRGTDKAVEVSLEMLRLRSGPHALSG